MDYLSTWFGSEAGETYEVPVAVVGLSAVTGFCEVWNFEQNKLRSYAFHKVMRLTDIKDGSVFEHAGSKLCKQIGGVMLMPADAHEFPLNAVGESYYEDALRYVVGVIEGATADFRCDAALVPYDTNPHDANAVAVQVDGLTIAHLGRHDAEAHRKALTVAGTPGARTMRPMLIAGGGIIDGEKQPFRVLLKITS